MANSLIGIAYITTRSDKNCFWSSQRKRGFADSLWTIQDSIQFWKALGRVCHFDDFFAKHIFRNNKSKKKNKNFKTSERPARITFESDGSNSGSGFRIRYLIEAADLCDPNPCENGGQCEENSGEFECTWDGSIFKWIKLTINIYNLKNSKKANQISSENWTGEMCETDVNECENEPCRVGLNLTFAFFSENKMLSSAKIRYFWEFFKNIKNDLNFQK